MTHSIPARAAEVRDKFLEFCAEAHAHLQEYPSPSVYDYQHEVLRRIREYATAHAHYFFGSVHTHTEVSIRWRYHIKPDTSTWYEFIYDWSQVTSVMTLDHTTQPQELPL